jgi:translation initiation factor 4A
MSRNTKRKSKGTPISWNALGSLSSPTEIPLASEEKREKVVDCWEELDSLNEAPKVEVKPTLECEDTRKQIFESNLENYEIPEGLTWEEKQAYLMRLDEEQAKLSPYYRDNFEEMGLNESIVHGIYSYGYDKPSRVQSRAITAVMTGRDCIVQAQSGTGKTATFVIGTLSNIREEDKFTQAIILSPTRELADQTFKVLQALSQYTNITSILCCGQMRLEVSIPAANATANATAYATAYANANANATPTTATGTGPKSESSLSIRNAQVIVGTTGRIIDCINRGQISLAGVKMLVLDEADEMLSQGFKEQVSEIHSKIPNKPQVCLFSATLSTEVMDYVKTITDEPIQILIRQEFVTLKGISQFYINCIKEDYKLETLIDIYKRYMCTQSIIYVNSKNKCCWLASELIRRNHTVLYMDSSMPQRERSNIMKQFRNGTCRILVTTNLLSRGIDVQGVNLVINYDLPNVNNIESYVHRIGRCGRYGRKGAAINFITPNDYYIIQNIRKFYSTEINELPEDISYLMTF